MCCSERQRAVAELGSVGHKFMITRAKVMIAIVCGLLAGLVFALQAFDWFVVRNAPIVTGRVVSRDPTTWLSIPRVDFAIRIDSPRALVSNFSVNQSIISGSIEITI